MYRFTLCLLVCLLATPVFAQIDHAFARASVPGLEDVELGHLVAVAHSMTPVEHFGGQFAAGAAAFAEGKIYNPNQANSIYLRTFAEVKEIAATNTIGGSATASAEAWWTDTARIRVPENSPPPAIRFIFLYNGIRTITRAAVGHGDHDNYTAIAAGYLTIQGDGIPFGAGQSQLATIDTVNGFQDVTTGNTYFDATLVGTQGVPNEYHTTFTGMIRSYVQTDYSHSVTSDYSHSFYFTGITLVDGRPLSDEGITLWFDSEREVPEPSTLLLLGISAISLLGYRKARSQR
jgi:hypothetical protein